MIEWMAQAAPLREAGKKMNGRLLLLSLNEITQYFKKWTTGSGIFKTICCLYNNGMLQTDPLKSSYSQRKHYPERTLRLKVLRKSSCLEKKAVRKVTLSNVIVYNCSSEIFTILY